MFATNNIFFGSIVWSVEIGTLVLKCLNSLSISMPAKVTRDVDLAFLCILNPWFLPKNLYWSESQCVLVPLLLLSSLFQKHPKQQEHLLYNHSTYRLLSAKNIQVTVWSQNNKHTRFPFPMSTIRNTKLKINSWTGIQLNQILHRKIFHKDIIFQK